MVKKSLLNNYPGPSWTTHNPASPHANWSPATEKEISLSPGYSTRIAELLVPPAIPSLLDVFPDCCLYTIHRHVVWLEERVVSWRVHPLIVGESWMRMQPLPVWFWSVRAGACKIVSTYTSEVHVEPWFLEHFSPADEPDKDGLYSRALGLRFQLDKRHFNNPLELKCSATVGGRTWDRVISPGLATLTNQKLAQESLRRGPDVGHLLPGNCVTARCPEVLTLTAISTTATDKQLQQNIIKRVHSIRQSPHFTGKYSKHGRGNCYRFQNTVKETRTHMSRHAVINPQALDGGQRSSLITHENKQGQIYWPATAGQSLSLTLTLSHMEHIQEVVSSTLRLVPSLPSDTILLPVSHCVQEVPHANYPSILYDTYRRYLLVSDSTAGKSKVVDNPARFSVCERAMTCRLRGRGREDKN
uniref:Uncharacterized protein n=1 Tax=Timema bartmani TaxID=61472 RepID=A0A7R9EXI9_9NEOP|nr:unnamed protein product [Timema bartmani]